MNRRDFLKAGLGGAAAFSMPLLPRLRPDHGLGTIFDIDLVAEAVSKQMIDGTSVTVWQLRNPAATGPGDLASGFMALEGDSFNVTLQNNLDRPINFAIPGVLSGTPEVAAGNSQLYSFAAPAAGSYFYTDEVNGEIGRAMGLAGPLVIMPEDGSSTLYAGGPTFDRQYTLALSELDDRLNQQVAAGGSYDMNNYEPNYFFVNGISFPDTRTDPDTLLASTQGEDVAIRFINTGAITNPMHFHGYHCLVATRNRVPETEVVEKDTTLVRIGECVDVILPIDQPGTFPLHTHYVPGVTANGVYANPYGGALLLIEAT
jgi:FtsP/CotA-like multicopper oxidase with cupredoxin domain